MNDSSFETRITLVTLLRGCVPDSVSLRFEFSFMNGSSFESMLGSFGHVCYVVAFQIRFNSRARIILVAYATWLRSRFGFAAFQIWFREAQVSSCARISLVAYATVRGCIPDSVSQCFEFGFVNGSSFELCSDHFGRVCYVVVFQIQFHEESAEYGLRVARSSRIVDPS